MGAKTALTFQKRQKATRTCDNKPIKMIGILKKKNLNQ